MKNLFIFIGAFGILVIALFFLLKNNITGLISSKQKATPSPVILANTPFPTPKILNFTSVNPQFNISYPENYLSENLSHINVQGNVSVVSFMPKETAKREADSITLRVLAGNGEATIADWLTKYATSYSKEDPNAANKGYYLYNVTDIQNITISGRDAVKFIQKLPDTENNLETTAFVSSDYAYLLVHMVGNVENIYQQMLSSLQF